MKMKALRKRRARSPEEGSAADAARAAVWPEDGRCPLCGRPMVRGSSVNDHHLVPRSKGGRARWTIHKVCHGKIHAVFTEAELAKRYSTFASLRGHPEIAAFIRWVRRKEPTFMSRNR